MEILCIKTRNYGNFSPFMFFYMTLREKTCVIDIDPKIMRTQKKFSHAHKKGILFIDRDLSIDTHTISMK